MTPLELCHALGLIPTHYDKYHVEAALKLLETLKKEK